MDNKELIKIHDMLVDLQCSIQHNMCFSIVKVTETENMININKEVQKILNYVSDLI